MFTGKLTSHLKFALLTLFSHVLALLYSHGRGGGNAASEQEPMVAHSARRMGDVSPQSLFARGDISFHPQLESKTGRRRFIPDHVLDELASRFQKRDIGEALFTLEEHSCVLSRAMVTSLPPRAKARPEAPDANKEKIESAFLDALDGEENWLPFQKRDSG